MLRDAVTISRSIATCHTCADSVFCCAFARLALNHRTKVYGLGSINMQVCRALCYLGAHSCTASGMYDMYGW